MKKSVLALAVLGTFAGVASAQGSVTLFGIVDLNVRTVSNDERTYSLGQDGLSSSRLGFRGVEDLGGGLKASFWLEGALGPDTGTGAGSFGNGSNQGLTFQRRSTVSLQNQWGELRLGRDYTATFWNWTVFDPFGTNGLGASSNLGLGYAITSAVGTGGAYGTAVRANNMVAYILPNGTFGPGLYGQVQVAAGEAAFGNKYYGGRIGYAAGPFNVAGAWGRTQVAQNVDLDNYNVAGSWNFGFAKLSGFYGHLELDGLGGSNADQDNWYVGITAPLGQAELRASYGQVKRTGSGVAASLEGQKANQWAIGGIYNLSKRTALYATYASIDNKNGAAFSVTPFASTLSPNNDSSGGEVGVRHSF
jgi:predicted porin